MSGLSVAFAVAITAIVVALLHFRSSNWRHNEFIVVRQGGLITYGPSDAATWSYDLKNDFAGAIFVLGHWYQAQIVTVGPPGRFQGIVAMYAFLLLVLLYTLYQFGTLREHQLDHPLFRCLVLPFRAIPQAVIGGLQMLTPHGLRFEFMARFRSYRSTYFHLVRQMAREYDVDEGDTNVTISRFDGDLIPSLNNCTFLQANGLLDVDISAENKVVVHASVDFDEVDGVQLTGDEVKKAAAFLAGDLFGRLRYPQVIALLSCSSLLTAAESLRNFGSLPKPREIRGFAQLYHVQGILLPEASERNGVTKDVDFRILDAKNESAECVNPENFVMLLAYRNKNKALEDHRFGVLTTPTRDSEQKE